MKIDSESWPTLSRLLEEWLDLPEESRATWVENLRPEYAEFQPAFRRMLLAQAGGAHGFLDTLPPLSVSPWGRNVGDQRFCIANGKTIGPYRLLRELGQGGMGVVWLAEYADGEIKRPVALKLPMLSLHNPSVVERFARERDILAQLTHPNIARLYDAGVDRDQPYLALEYVEGEKITVYCDDHSLSLKARLRLFLQVLRAVQYAHTNLIVHRDLKPSNILVTNGHEANVRLLDFGIAKLLTDGETKETELTRFGGRALTPDYASPEQIAGSSITTASDVYSLGVILYELLTGERPYKLKRDTRNSLEDAILGSDPVRPSQAVDNEAKARARSMTPAKLSRALKGDLDSIVLKALSKGSQNRYLAADAFAQDIENYLDGKPVLAQPESSWYRAGKLIKRNKLAVGSATAVIAALGIGLGIALWQAHIAQVQTRTAETVRTFLLDIFRANSSEQADPVKGRQTTARELLDIGAKKIDSALNEAPEAKLSVLAMLSNLYSDLGLNDQGVILAKKRIALAKSVYGPIDPRVARALVDLALNSGESSFVNERPALLKEISGILDHNQDFNSQTRAGYDFAVASVFFQSDIGKSADFIDRAIKLYRRYPPSSEMAAALYLSGVVEVRRKRYRAAIQVLSEAAQITNSLQGEARHSLPAIYTYLGESQFFLLDLPAAERNYRSALDTARSLKGEDHVDVLQTKYRLGSFLVLTSRPQEGLQLGKEAVDLALRTTGPENLFHTPMVRAGYGSSLLRYGRLEEGLTLISQGLEVQRRGKRNLTRTFAEYLERMADGETELGHFRQAKALLDESFAVHAIVGDTPSSGRLDDALLTRVRLLIAMGQVNDAESAIRSIPAESAAGGNLSLQWLDVALARGAVKLASGQYDEAVKQAHDVRTRVEANSLRAYLKRFEAPALLEEGKGLLLAGRASEALPLLQRTVQLGSEIYDPQSSPAQADAQIALAKCLLALGRRDQAPDLLVHAKAIHSRHKDLGEQFRKPLNDLQFLLVSYK